MATRTGRTYVRAGDTEPLEITVGATGVADLTDATTVVLYAREEDADTNHVDGATCTIPDTAEMVVSFDPAGNGPGGANAWDTGDEGTYECYVLITWADGDETRHPAAEDGTLKITVTEAFE